MCAAACSHAEAADPLDSSKTLNLKTFATLPELAATAKAIDLEHPKDGSGRVFVSTNVGKVHGYTSTGDYLGVFLDLDAESVAPDFLRQGSFTTQGLSYIAFHPDHARPGAGGEGAFYTMYKSREVGVPDPDYSLADEPTRVGDVLAQYVLAEWRIDPANPDRIDASSRREVIRFEYSGIAENSHAVGEIGFNPFARPGDDDYGHLFIGLGDGNTGGGVLDLQHVQNTDNPFGKILRIDPLPAGDDKYSIPADNPLADGGPLLDDDGNVEEIWAVGFRYPQNFSFARDSTGKARLLAFDIGADDYEEVDLVDLGDNHGWTRYDGPDDGNLDTILNPHGSLTLEWPATGYDHVFPSVPGAEPTGGNAAVTGGFVVSDPTDPTFQDQALFGDLAHGSFFHADFAEMVAADADDTQAPLYVMNVSVDGAMPGSFPEQLVRERGDARFGIDERGRVFVISRQTNVVYLTDLVADQQALPGDYDRDDDVDGSDFLEWQRGNSPAGASLQDLVSWERRYGTPSTVWPASSRLLPEASALALATFALMVWVCSGHPRRNALRTG